MDQVVRHIYQSFLLTLRTTLTLILQVESYQRSSVTLVYELTTLLVVVVGDSVDDHEQTKETFFCLVRHVLHDNWMEEI